jgi:hypothetical protein
MVREQRPVPAWKGNGGISGSDAHRRPEPSPMLPRGSGPRRALRKVAKRESQASEIQDKQCPLSLCVNLEQRHCPVLKMFRTQDKHFSKSLCVNHQDQEINIKTSIHSHKVLSVKRGTVAAVAA